MCLHEFKHYNQTTIECVHVYFTFNFAEKAQAYRPPQARGTSASIKLHEYEGPSDPNKKVSQGEIHFLLNSLKYKFILHVPFK